MSNPISWQGASGNNYQFEAFPLNASFNSVDGNYIFAKQTLQGFDAVYIGQGNLKERIAYHINEGCVISKGATHVFAHVNQSETARKAEENDLLGFNTEAYQPIGCNIRIGG